MLLIWGHLCGNAVLMAIFHWKKPKTSICRAKGKLWWSSTLRKRWQISSRSSYLGTIQLLYKVAKSVLDFSVDLGSDSKAGPCITCVCIIMKKYFQDRRWDSQALVFISASYLWGKHRTDTIMVILEGSFLYVLLLLFLGRFWNGPRSNFLDQDQI